MKVPLSKPVVIVGTGRCGSSVLHRTLAWHHRVAWLSTALERRPGAISRNRLLMQAIDFPLVGRLFAAKCDAAECYRYWDHLFPGFSVSCRDLIAGDVSNYVRDRVRNSLARTLTAQRSRLLLKITGWPRLGFLREIFPDVRFIHVLRDGRAVAASLLRMDWWLGWRGPLGWRWGELSPEQRAEWSRHGQSFVALAGIQWKILMDAMEAAKASIPPDTLYEMRYEDLCREPERHVRAALEFVGLGPSPEVERAVRVERWRAENAKWRADLTTNQQAILHAVLESHLRRYGYA